jgi:hypothetical protein
MTAAKGIALRVWIPSLRQLIHGILPLESSVSAAWRIQKNSIESSENLDQAAYGSPEYPFITSIRVLERHTMYLFQESCETSELKLPCLLQFCYRSNDAPRSTPFLGPSLGLDTWSYISYIYFSLFLFSTFTSIHLNIPHHHIHLSTHHH